MNELKRKTTSERARGNSRMELELKRFTVWLYISVVVRDGKVALPVAVAPPTARFARHVRGVTDAISGGGSSLRARLLEQPLASRGALR